MSIVVTDGAIDFTEQLNLLYLFDLTSEAIGNVRHLLT